MNNGLLKTHHCGQLNSSHVGQKVTLGGWLDRYRNLGGLHFITLRDKYGVIQLGFENFEGNDEDLKSIGLESVIQVEGEVIKRPDDAINKNMPTGEIEVQVKKLNILSKALDVPFLPHSKTQATEDLRLKYRYLDIRSNKIQKFISLRSETTRKIRNVLYGEEFTEVETPILYKTTPEGARDYIVPSRVHPGKVYALPQSPQTLKQLLMIGSTDRYFQICRCFRDEDLRADRQPEFSQVDIEVSFSTAEYMRALALKIVNETFRIDLKEIPIMNYDEAMSKYGSDKPDARFGLEHHVVSSLFEDSSFDTFKKVSKTGMIKSIFLPSKLGELARKKIDALTEIAKPHGAGGVAWFKVKSEELTGGISKFITEDIKKSLFNISNEDGLWLFVADQKESVAHSSLDAVRRHLGKELELYNKEDYKFLWINDFPLFDSKEGEDRLFACHHPFTSPKASEIELFLSDDRDKVINMKAEAYDLVCNGYELGGGSIRIYDSKIQAQMFKYLGFSEEEAKRQFGFFIEALRYGTPPHGGIALGLDRLIMLIGQTDNIRDVIAFPKTNSATDLMANSPSLANADQLEELGIKFNLKE